ncbi:hypothetical protein BGW80DRAFT_1460562 [Lactifluus volemus]|nr:hypothetical protein BGW80DRAFT_1460562 [Lactifluus volemus]
MSSGLYGQLQLIVMYGNLYPLGHSPTASAKLKEAQDARRTGRIKAIEAFEPRINAAPTWTSRDLHLCSADMDVLESSTH